MSLNQSASRSKMRVAAFTSLFTGLFHAVIAMVPVILSVTVNAQDVKIAVSGSHTPPDSLAGSGSRTQPDTRTYAEKLGFPKGAKVIILHVDDVGMSFESNKGAEEAMDKGIASSASVMMPCPWVPDYVHYLKEHPLTDAGLHLTLTAEWDNYRWPPLSGKPAVPGLVDSEGTLWPEAEDVVKHASPGEVETEIRAQIERARQMGFEPTHLDSHMFTLFASLAFSERYIKVGIEYKIPVMFPCGHNTLIKQEGVIADKVMEQTAAIGKRLWEAGLPVIDDLHSVSYSTPLPDGMDPTEANRARFKTDQYIREFGTLQPGITMIIIHCTDPTDEFRYISASGPGRKSDLAAMLSPELKEYIQKQGIIITNWRELKRRRDRIATPASAAPSSLTPPSATSPSAASRSAPSRPVKELAPGVFYYFGDELQQKSANCIWVVFKDYVLAVDANYPWGAQDILQEIRKTTSKPVRFLFDTHYHHDHTFGNGVFVDAGASIVSTDETAAEMHTLGQKEWDQGSAYSGRDMKGFRREFPSLTFDRRLVFDDGEHRVELIRMGPAHTGGDGVAWLPKERILATGDLCVNGNPWGNNVGDEHADYDKWLAVLDTLAGWGVKTLIPGHGEPGTTETLRSQRVYLADMLDQVRRGIKAGKSKEQLIKEIDLSKHPVYGENKVSIRRAIGLMYDKLKRQ